LAGLDPEGAGADPDEAAFALADLASASRFAIADLDSASLVAIADFDSRSLSRDAADDRVIVDKSEPKKSEAVGVIVSARVSSPRTMTSSAVSSNICVRTYSARIAPYCNHDGERRPISFPRRIR